MLQMVDDRMDALYDEQSTLTSVNQQMQHHPSEVIMDGEQDVVHR